MYVCISSTCICPVLLTVCHYVSLVFFDFLYVEIKDNLCMSHKMLWAFGLVYYVHILCVDGGIKETFLYQ